MLYQLQPKDYKILVIQVTRKDIREGIGVNASECAVARAIKRTTGEPVSVTSRSVRAINGGGRTPFPPKVKRWVIRFDEYKSWPTWTRWLIRPRPITFKIDTDFLQKANASKTRNSNARTATASLQ